jgi:hypothetical protein
MNNEQVKSWIAKKCFRIDKFSIGFIIGLIVPIIVLWITYHVNFKNYSIKEFIDFLKQFKVLTKLISLCVLPNLAVFFIFLYPNFLRAARGTLAATILAAIIVVILQLILGTFVI